MEAATEVKERESIMVIRGKKLNYTLKESIKCYIKGQIFRE